MTAEPDIAAQEARTPRVRQRLEVRGRVQGVGFRPFVYRLAQGLQLAGLVGNDSHGAFIEVEGSLKAVESFTTRLRAELPPLARIADLTARPLSPRQDVAFIIEASESGAIQDAEITPDVATCDDCRRELFDPADRRFRYPFINCTNCGPRYSIIRAVPYDRPNTTMARFTMCSACQAEYDDPANRRFHAQPNACPVCGPRVWLHESDSDTTDAGTRGRGDAENEEDPIRRCVALLRAGRIVAIKGLGGFHLACQADEDEAVARLRFRKARESKPLAMMVASLDAARQLAAIDDSVAAAMTDVTRPIVLVPKLDTARISRQVAPGTDLFGLMLPYTPLHELLFTEGLGPVVMTSGNPTEEPLCRDNEEAMQRLSGIADAFLLHDRDIERRVDDSVVIAVDRPISRVVPIRRARGFAPAPIEVGIAAPVPILAVGGELKSTVCVLAGTSAIVSEHLGELSNAKAYRNFVDTIERFKALLRVEPLAIAYDLHPDYAASRYGLRYAQEHRLIAVGVQHHHAHIVSAMADNGLTGKVVGIACDGTGYGPDGAVWGCEVMVADEADFERAGHLRYFPLLGGDVVARETWRPAAALLHETYGTDWPSAAGVAVERIAVGALKLAAQRLSNAARLTRTSSLGRLFDAVAFILGVCDQNRHEAEAAMALEALAWRAGSVEPLTFGSSGGEDSSGPTQFDVRPMIRDLVAGCRGGQPVEQLARAFHETIGAMLAEAAIQVATRTGLDRVVLSGGCWVNRLLLAIVEDRLRSVPLQVYTHRELPPGDGGISLGQAVCAARRLADSGQGKGTRKGTREQYGAPEGAMTND